MISLIITVFEYINSKTNWTDNNLLIVLQQSLNSHIQIRRLPRTKRNKEKHRPK